jgi:hypothetical protein
MINVNVRARARTRTRRCLAATFFRAWEGARARVRVQGKLEVLHDVRHNQMKVASGEWPVASDKWRVASGE